MGRRTRTTALLALVALGACDSFATDPGANGGGLPAGAVGRIVVENASSDFMSGVYFAPCGLALTENRGTITAHTSREWTVTPGCYDVRAVSSSGSWGPTRGDVGSSSTLTVTFTD